MAGPPAGGLRSSLSRMWCPCAVSAACSVTCPGEGARRALRGVDAVWGSSRAAPEGSWGHRERRRLRAKPSRLSNKRALLLLRCAAVGPKPAFLPVPSQEVVSCCVHQRSCTQVASCPPSAPERTWAKGLHGHHLLPPSCPAHVPNPPCSSPAAGSPRKPPQSWARWGSTVHIPLPSCSPCAGGNPSAAFVERSARWCGSVHKGLSQ